MDPEIYKKIGRGGAGNYYSKQDLDDAAKHAADPSADPQNTSIPPPENHHASSDYTNIGRGGAGNFVKRDASGPPNNNHPVAAKNATGPLREMPEVGYSGRGGAGNLRGKEEMERRRMEGERRAKEAREKAHEEVVKDVEMGLQMPERAHLGSEKIE